jgi:hypothetical protein
VLVAVSTEDVPGRISAHRETGALEGLGREVAGIGVVDLGICSSARRLAECLLADEVLRRVACHSGGAYLEETPGAAGPVNGGLVGRRRGRRIVTAAARRKREANDHAGSAERTGHLDQYERLMDSGPYPPPRFNPSRALLLFAQSAEALTG